jgi:hypothetical protein
MRVYQLLSEKQLNKFLKPYNTDTGKEKLVEIKEGELFGDFICVAGYKFKLTFGRYQCLETPTAKIEKQTINAFKAPNDRYRK